MTCNVRGQEYETWYITSKPSVRLLPLVRCNEPQETRNTSIDQYNSTAIVSDVQQPTHVASDFAKSTMLNRLTRRVRIQKRPKAPKPDFKPAIEEFLGNSTGAEFNSFRNLVNILADSRRKRTDYEPDAQVIWDIEREPQAMGLSCPWQKNITVPAICFEEVSSELIRVRDEQEESCDGESSEMVALPLVLYTAVRSKPVSILSSTFRELQDAL